jgi:hypothetical protein
MKQQQLQQAEHDNASTLRDEMEFSNSDGFHPNRTVAFRLRQRPCPLFLPVARMFGGVVTRLDDTNP